MLSLKTVVLGTVVLGTVFLETVVLRAVLLKAVVLDRRDGRLKTVVLIPINSSSGLDFIPAVPNVFVQIFCPLNKDALS